MNPSPKTIETDDDVIAEMLETDHQIVDNMDRMIRYLTPDGAISTDWLRPEN